jgi:hypothetical protein
MSEQIRAQGIYDTRTMTFLEEKNIPYVGLDFRPKSFNFLPQYKFFEIVENSKNLNSKLCFHYCDEQNFVIQKMIDDIQNGYEGARPCGLKHGDYLLEFSDVQETSYYNSFKTDFYWHYKPISEFKDILKSNYLKGIVLDFKFLKELHEENNFHNFVNNFYQLFLERKDTVKLILEVDWDDDIFPSIWNFFDFSIISLPVNNKVEVCYRNVDLNKFSQYLGHYGV